MKRFSTAPSRCRKTYALAGMGIRGQIEFQEMRESGASERTGRGLQNRYNGGMPYEGGSSNDYGSGDSDAASGTGAAGAAGDAGAANNAITR